MIGGIDGGTEGGPNGAAIFRGDNAAIFLAAKPNENISFIPLTDLILDPFRLQRY